jgi:cystathionine beta-lyase/cystathionine gamma-synthase
MGWSYTFVDGARPETWAAARRPNTRLFLTESISNPLMRVARHQEIVDFARQHGLTTMIDNTFASPVNFQPLTIGYDVCFHSATKYLNGHSDLVAGCVMSSQATIERVRHALNLFGGSLDPHAGFLLTRGIKTLALRIRAQNANGLALAQFLRGHPRVEAVNYPGLDSHPDHAHAAPLLRGFGGMVSFRPKGGVDAAERVLGGLRIPYVAPSLGGVETLATRPALTSHAGMSPEDRAKVGITDDLIRVSCGIEGADDLIRDFGHALDAA